jgi:uncharacterized membrane protein
MCYSKEVQLATGLVIILSSLAYYFYYSRKYSGSKKRWLKPLFDSLLGGALCIGGHQFFEFLSLATGSQVVYKIGLLISLSSIYFLIRSLEILVNKDLHSGLAWIVVAAAGAYNLLIPMSFEGFSFYLRHNSGFVWASLWMLLFIYWHACSFSAINQLKDKPSKRAVIWYMLCAIDISFILSVAYTIWGFFRFSVNVCTDAPSIWCTFFVLQSAFIPIFLSMVPVIFRRPARQSILSARQTIIILLISLAVLAIMILTLPLFRCLSWKFVFP